MSLKERLLILLGLQPEANIDPAVLEEHDALLERAAQIARRPTDDARREIRRRALAAEAASMRRRQ